MCVYKCLDIAITVGLLIPRERLCVLTLLLRVAGGIGGELAEKEIYVCFVGVWLNAGFNTF